MRVATSTISENIIAQIQKLGVNQARMQNQVATGQRLFQPDDDPAAIGRVLDLESQQRLLSQYDRNADRALTISQATFSGLKGIKQISDRATEVGTLGTGTINAEANSAYAIEINQLIEQALQITNSKLGNDHLYAGTAVDAPPFVATRDAQGRVTSVAYAGNANQAEIPLSASTSLAAGTSNDTNLAMRDFLNHLVALRDALQTSDRPGISAAYANLVSTEDKFVSALGENGGIQTRIEASRVQQRDTATSIESLISRETDADMPTAIVKLNQIQTAYQAALQSGSNIMRMSLLDYIN